MPKMTEQEAIEYVERQGANWPDDRSNYVRYCFHCGYWVHVDDYSGNDDKCDDC